MGLNNLLIAGGLKEGAFQALNDAENKKAYHAKLQVELLACNVFLGGKSLENSVDAWVNLNQFEVFNGLPLSSTDEPIYSPQIIYENIRLGAVAEIDQNNPCRGEALFELQERFSVPEGGCGVRPLRLFEITPDLVHVSYEFALSVETNPERIIELYERWDKFTKQHPFDPPIFWTGKSLADLLPKYRAARRATKID